jgi:hypothetical protein
MTTGTKQLVKVRYFLGTTEKLSTFEYTYFTEEPLQVGDEVIVPVKDTTGKAKVTSVEVPMNDVVAFIDKVKTIPANSKVIAGVPNNQKLGETAAAGLTEPGGSVPNETETVIRVDPGACLAPATAIIKIAPGNDPAVIALKAEVDKIREYALKRTITSETDCKLATEDLTLISALSKSIDAKLKEYTGPINEHLKAVREAFKQLSEPLDIANETNRSKILAYRKAIEQRVREIEEINRQKTELARREAALNDGEITVDTTPVPVPVVSATIQTDVGTGSMVTVKKWEVEDLSKVPVEYMMIDAAKVGKVVRAGIPSIPGIRIWEEKTLRVSAR